MAVTYSELTQQILDYTEVSTDVLTATRTNDFIEHAENRIFRDVDLDVFKSHQTANLVADSAFLSLPGGTTPTPESLGTIRTMQIFSPSATTRSFLEQRDISYMNEYARSNSDRNASILGMVGPQHNLCCTYTRFSL